MNISLAAMKKVAEGLKRRNQHVSARKIAQELKVPTHRVESYLKKITGLKIQLGIVENSENIAPESKKYRVAIQRLRNERLIITYSRIARMAKASRCAAKMWCLRHPDVMKGVPLVSEHVLNRHRLQQRMRWYVRMRKARKLKITVTDLARALDVGRKDLHCLFRESPDFRNELSI